MKKMTKLAWPVRSLLRFYKTRKIPVLDVTKDLIVRFSSKNTTLNNPIFEPHVGIIYAPSNLEFIVHPKTGEYIHSVRDEEGSAKDEKINLHDFLEGKFKRKLYFQKPLTPEKLKEIETAVKRAVKIMNEELAKEKNSRKSI
ncbi:Uncharacterised protein [uncultured archaeon]|nr:Uncharacterised protein [uncultured archaeon]